MSNPVNTFNKNSFPILPGLLFINGVWKPAASGKTFDLINPADESIITHIASCGPEEVHEAVAAAKEAFDKGPWKDMQPSQRANLLFRR